MGKFPTLTCVKCGVTVEAGCDCGAPYSRAFKAVSANPEKSDRAIAAEVGVGKDTVRRARASTGASAPVAKRVGKDGKARSLPKTRKPKREYRNPILSAANIVNDIAGEFLLDDGASIADVIDTNAAGPTLEAIKSVLSAWQRVYDALAAASSVDDDAPRSAVGNAPARDLILDEGGAK